MNPILEKWCCTWLKLPFFCFLTFFAGQAVALDPEDLLPAEQAFKVSAAAVDAERIRLHWVIADGYYLYKDKFKLVSKTADIELLEAHYPEAETKHDVYFGEMQIYRKQLDIVVPLHNAKHVRVLQLQAKYQGCADIGICYPPQKTLLTIDLPAPVDTAKPLDKLVRSLKGLQPSFFQHDLLPADQAFQFFAAVKNGRTLHVNWIIAEDYYLYRDKIAFDLSGDAATRIGSYQIPQGELKVDEAFGQVEIFHNELAFELPLLRNSSAAGTITLRAKYQGCAERGVCYPPMQKSVTLALPALSDLQISGPVQSEPLSEQQQIVQSLRQDSLWLTLLSFFGFGLLLSVTPCIFPMIPILSGIIVGHGKPVGTQRAFLLSLSFVLASAATYTVFGIIAALFGSNLQAVLQEPWVIVSFSAIFILLSLSMFGFYNLEIPKSWQARLHNASERRRNGSYLGAAIMGALSSLIVGPCVAAPLAGALIYIGQTGDAFLGGSALFMMGLGMGMPLLLVGASAGSLLPKAGPWLKTTKAIFGVIMLAVAVWMLERVLPGEISMLLWAMLLIIPAIYLSAIDPLPEQASNWRKLWKGAGLISLVYGILLLIGLSMGNTNPLKPLQGLQAAAPQAQTNLVFRAIHSLDELDNSLQQAALRQQWVLVDFYADWCISCKEMERYTFADAQVKKHLANFVLLRADVTKNSADDLALLKQFDLIGPPAILFFDPKRQEHPELRVIGYQDAESFITHLQKTSL